jgi:hypothetical protein
MADNGSNSTGLELVEPIGDACASMAGFLFDVVIALL